MDSIWTTRRWLLILDNVSRSHETTYFTCIPSYWRVSFNGQKGMKPRKMDRYPDSSMEICIWAGCCPAQATALNSIAFVVLCLGSKASGRLDLSLSHSLCQTGQRGQGCLLTRATAPSSFLPFACQQILRGSQSHINYTFCYHWNVSDCCASLFHAICKDEGSSLWRNSVGLFRYFGDPSTGLFWTTFRQPELFISFIQELLPRSRQELIAIKKSLPKPRSQWNYLVQ